MWGQGPKDLPRPARSPERCKNEVPGPRGSRWRHHPTCSMRYCAVSPPSTGIACPVVNPSGVIFTLATSPRNAPAEKFRGLFQTGSLRSLRTSPPTSRPFRR